MKFNPTNMLYWLRMKEIRGRRKRERRKGEKRKLHEEEEKYCGQMESNWKVDELSLFVLEFFNIILPK